MMMDVVPHFINGQVRNVPSQKSYQVTNPALGEVTPVMLGQPGQRPHQ